MNNMEKFFRTPGGSFIRVYWMAGYKYDDVADYGNGEVLFWGGKEFDTANGMTECTEAEYCMALDLFIESLTARIDGLNH